MNFEWEDLNPEFHLNDEGVQFSLLSLNPHQTKI